MLRPAVEAIARALGSRESVRNSILLSVTAVSGAFPAFGAGTTHPSAEPAAGTGVYRRLSEEWACATVRLYSHLQSATADERRDWGEHWRMAEVGTALQSLPDRSTCLSAPELDAIKALVKQQAISESREQEFLRLIWLRSKLTRTDYDPRYPDSSLVPATIKGMQALGWGDQQILAAVTGRNVLESRMLTNALVESVSQQVKSEQEPYRDPTTKELLQQFPATVGAAGDAAQSAAKSAQHKQPAQPPAASHPPVSP